MDADSWPLGLYVLLCCGSICHEVVNFIQIASGHTVTQNLMKLMLFSYESLASLHQLNMIRRLVKFRYSEKATKF